MKNKEEIRKGNFKIKDNDMVYTIGRFVNLKKIKGSVDELIGYCPFHKSLSPGFIVNVKDQSFHCKNCGISGNGSMGKVIFISRMLKEVLNNFQQLMEELVEIG